MANKNKVYLITGVLICTMIGILVIDPKARKFPSEASSRPNVLLISLDACRADHLSSYGYHRKTSPFLDEIVRNGVRFENAFVNTHGTPPSHTTMLSSLYQETHKVAYDAVGHRNISRIVPSQVPLIQEILQRHG